jgi:hypothetical protein
MEERKITTDEYLMQIARLIYVRGMKPKDSKKVALGDFRLERKTKTEKRAEALKNYCDKAKAFFGNLAGLKHGN